MATHLSGGGGGDGGGPYFEWTSVGLAPSAGVPPLPSTSPMVMMLSSGMSVGGIGGVGGVVGGEGHGFGLWLISLSLMVGRSEAEVYRFMEGSWMYWVDGV